MAGAREMRLRMRSVRNITQVTRALEAVSASKVRQAQVAVLGARAYSDRAAAILESLANQPGDVRALHPLLEERPVANIGMLLITSDRGLAGAYNLNMVRMATKFWKEQTVPVRWVTVGNKGRELMVRAGAKIVSEFSSFRRSPSFAEISPVARTLLTDFLAGTVDEVYVASTDFINTLKLQPTIFRLLPMTLDKPENPVAVRSGAKQEYIFEPSAAELLNEILPRFVMVQVFQAVLEAQASEHSARMVAMRNATDNAMEISASQQLAYNKARQLAITSDLLDIAGGVEALSKAAVQPARVNSDTMVLEA